jgi:hypothetical protein
VRRILILAPLALTATFGLVLAAQNQPVQTPPPNAPHQKPAFPGQTRAPERVSNVAFDVVTVVPELESPGA